LKPGEIIFESTTDEPRKMAVPLCTARDAEIVHALITDGNTIRVSQDPEGLHGCEKSATLQKVSGDATRPETPQKTETPDLVALANMYVQKDENSLSQLAGVTGINKGTLSQILNGKRPLSEGVAEKLQPVLQPGNVIDFTERKKEKEEEKV
jgi:transcriptional regulator with XRE-family HTH domain